MKSIKSTSIKIVVFAAVMILLLVLVMQALTRPIPGDLDSFHAQFKDVSGLKKGDDVRMLGVQVGKVTDVSVHQSSDHRLSNAIVSFTVKEDRPLRADTVLAIRYQNLTGSRYLDLQTTGKDAQKVKPGTTIDERMTRQSFDITSVFRGLKPVLSTLSPDDINHLTQSVLAVIEGNGKGLGPLLESLNKVISVTNNKDAVLTRLITNLGSVSAEIGGDSPGMTKLLQDLELFSRTLAGNAADMRQWSDVTSGVIARTNALLAALGLTPNSNAPLDAIVANALPTAEHLVNALATLPGIVEILNESTKPQGGTAVSLECSNGEAELPGMMNLFVAGQKVTVCNAK